MQILDDWLNDLEEMQDKTTKFWKLNFGRVKKKKCKNTSRNPRDSRSSSGKKDWKAKKWNKKDKFALVFCMRIRRKVIVMYHILTRSFNNLMQLVGDAIGKDRETLFGNILGDKLLCQGYYLSELNHYLVASIQHSYLINSYFYLTPTCNYLTLLEPGYT